MTNEYRKAEGVNWSTLKAILESPLAYQHACVQSDDPTPAMVWGSLIHLHMLQSAEAIAAGAVRVPDEYLTASGSISTAKAAKEWLASLGDGVIAMTPAQQADVARVLESVMAHGDATEWLRTASTTEQPIYWTDAATGIACKGLPDARGGGLLLDVKTWAPRGKFSAEAFVRDAVQRGYFGQLGYYAAGLEANGERVQRMGWIVVQSAAPHDVMVLELDADAVDFAHREARSALDRLAEWRSEGCPDEGAAPGVTMVSLPRWMRTDHNATADDVGF